MRKDTIAKVGLGFVALSGLFLPLWSLSFNTPTLGQSWATVTVFGSGSVDGPIATVNLANHYVGLQAIVPSEIFALKVVPMAFVAVSLIFFLAAWKLPFRVQTLLLLAIVLAIPAGIQYWLYEYGHGIAPGAPIAVEPFTPYVVGPYHIANFNVVSYLNVGYLLLAGILVASFFVHRRWEPHP